MSMHNYLLQVVMYRRGVPVGVALSQITSKRSIKSSPLCKVLHFQNSNLQIKYAYRPSS